MVLTILVRSQRTAIMKMGAILAKILLAIMNYCPLPLRQQESLQSEGLIEKQFGKKIPIIVHGLEYAWYDIEAARNANPNVEAETFLKTCGELGLCFYDEPTFKQFLSVTLLESEN